MIISHKHKFIFIKTRKTAGTSLEIALGAICGPEDVITRISMKDERERRKSYRGAQNYRMSVGYYDRDDWKKLLLQGRFKRYENHDQAGKIKSFIQPEHWKSYFKFCFERNPWDKMVSHYFWKKEAYNLDNFSDYWEKGLAGEIVGFSETINARNQYSIDGEVVMDRIFKYEDLTGSLAAISERIGLQEPLQMPEYKAKGTHRSEKTHYRDLLTEIQAKQIAEICKQEIKLLKYIF